MIPPDVVMRNAALFVAELIPHLRDVRNGDSLVRYMRGIACLATIPRTSLDELTWNQLQIGLHAFLNPGGARESLVCTALAELSVATVCVCDGQGLTFQPEKSATLRGRPWMLCTRCERVWVRVSFVCLTSLTVHPSLAAVLGYSLGYSFGCCTRCTGRLASSTGSPQASPPPVSLAAESTARWEAAPGMLKSHSPRITDAQKITACAFSRSQAALSREGRNPVCRSTHFVVSSECV